MVKEGLNEQPIVINTDKTDEYKKIIQAEKDLKHQNILIESTIAKYFDSIEEKKKLNENIEKILGLLQTNIGLSQKDIIQKNNESSIPIINIIILICVFILIILVIIDITLRFSK